MEKKQPDIPNLDALQTDAKAMLGDTAASIILTNYEPNNTRRFYTAQISNTHLRIVETSPSHKTDMVLNYDDQTVYLNGTPQSDAAYAEFGAKLKPVLHDIQANRATIFEETLPAPTQDPVDQGSPHALPDIRHTLNIKPLSGTELETIIGGMLVHPNASLTELNFSQSFNAARALTIQEREAKAQLSPLKSIKAQRPKGNFSLPKAQKVNKLAVFLGTLIGRLTLLKRPKPSAHGQNFPKPPMRPASPEQHVAQKWTKQLNSTTNLTVKELQISLHEWAKSPAGSKPVQWLQGYKSILAAISAIKADPKFAKRAKIDQLEQQLNTQFGKSPIDTVSYILKSLENNKQLNPTTRKNFRTLVIKNNKSAFKGKTAEELFKAGLGYVEISRYQLAPLSPDQIKIGLSELTSDESLKPEEIYRRRSGLIERNRDSLEDLSVNELKNASLTLIEICVHGFPACTLSDISEALSKADTQSELPPLKRAETRSQIIASNRKKLTGLTFNELQKLGLTLEEINTHKLTPLTETQMQNLHQEQNDKFSKEVNWTLANDTHVNEFSVGKDIRRDFSSDTTILLPKETIETPTDNREGEHPAITNLIKILDGIQKITTVDKDKADACIDKIKGTQMGQNELITTLKHHFEDTIYAPILNIFFQSLKVNIAMLQTQIGKIGQRQSAKNTCIHSTITFEGNKLVFTDTRALYNQDIDTPAKSGRPTEGNDYKGVYETIYSIDLTDPHAGITVDTQLMYWITGDNPTTNTKVSQVLTDNGGENLGGPNGISKVLNQQTTPHRKKVLSKAFQHLNSLNV